jgi:hypothetical protein
MMSTRTRLGIRFGSYLITALVAGFIVVVTQAFSPSTAAWITFGAGVFFVVSASAQVIWSSLAHRLVHVSTEILGILIIIESLIASGSTVKWLSFAGALAVLAVELIGLTIHELSTERVVHSIEVSSEKTNARQPALS